MNTPGISREFSTGELLRFAAPSIVMMLFLSMYTIVDGFFISRFVGTAALSATNIVYPLIGFFLAVGIMFATGGSAVVASEMGRGEHREASGHFTAVVLTAVGFSVLAGAACLTFTDPVLDLLGASADTWAYGREYITILLVFMPMSMLQCLFQSFLVTAGRPGLGLGLTVGAGLANMVLDYLFIVPLQMGIAGAALATAIGYCIPAVGGLWFFFRNRGGLCFTRPLWDFSVLLRSCANGASEMVTNLASSIITVVFNLILMAWIGTEGVAAITVIMYAQFLMVAFFMGFSIGVAPVFGYHYGAGNHRYLLRIRDHCIRFVLGASVVVAAVSYLSSGLIAVLFAPEGSLTAQLVDRGMRLFSLSFLFAGYNIFASALFTALSDGRTSAQISFARTFFFILVGIWLMTTLLGLDGLWLAIPFAELVTAELSFYMIRTRFLADARKLDE